MEDVSSRLYLLSFCLSHLLVNHVIVRPPLVKQFTCEFDGSLELLCVQYLLCALC